MDELLDLPELVDKIQELLEVGLYDEALKLLEYYSLIYQEEWEIYFLLSRVYLEQNDPRTAIFYLNKSLRIESSNVDSLLGLFYAHSQIGPSEKSRALSAARREILSDQRTGFKRLDLVLYRIK